MTKSGAKNAKSRTVHPVDTRRNSGQSPKPPQRYREFVERFPTLARAWDTLHEAGMEGPLDASTQRLVKLAVALGALREGAVRSGARKARSQGVDLAEVEQLVALAAPTIGMPAAVACWSWCLDAWKA